MDTKAMVKALSARMGPPKARAAFGTWPAFAWVVRGLTEQGYGITEAVREVLENSGFPATKQNFGSLRAAFYKIKTADWPAELSNAAVKKANEETEFE